MIFQKNTIFFFFGICFLKTTDTITSSCVIIKYHCMFPAIFAPIIFTSYGYHKQRDGWFIDCNYDDIFAFTASANIL